MGQQKSYWCFSFTTFFSLLITFPHTSNIVWYSGISFAIKIRKMDSLWLVRDNCSSSSNFCNRYASLINLLILFLSTARLKFLPLTEMPACNWLISFEGSHSTFNGNTVKELPSAKICCMILRLFNLFSFLKKYRLAVFNRY